MRSVGGSPEEVNVGRFRPTIRLRLTLLYGGLFLLAGAVLLGVNYGLVRNSLDDRLEPVAVEFSEGLAPGTPIFDELVPVPGTPVGGVRVQGPSDEAAAALARLEEQFRNKALHALVVQSSVALGIMAVASVGLGWLVAGRALRPLAQVTATARQLSEDNLHQRLDLAGPPDELKELADTFDAMLERLEAAFEGQRRFAANASHELRTPLSIQRAVVDVALADPDTSTEELRAMAVAVRDAVGRSEQLIDGLLVLARSTPASLEREPCDLAEAAAVALDQAAAEMAERRLTVERRLAPAPVAANRVLLERLVANLVLNAVRHNGEAGWLTVETLPGATIRVRNSGPVITPDQVDGLFEPFRRAAADRTRPREGRGVGLGLSIVRAIVTSHGGSVHAHPLAEGGLDVTVTLPPGAGE
jgi:signal transduction histidine kinase